MKAKMLAKTLKKKYPELYKNDELTQTDLNRMKFVISLKLASHTIVRTTLMLTKGLIIVEDCTKRQRGSGLFWGAAEHEDGTWRGENHLGKLWMELREELME